MKTTFSRNFFTHTLILLIALLMVGVSFQFLVKSYLENKAVEQLTSNCSTIAQVTAAYHTDNSLTKEDFLINLAVANQVSGADAVICDPKGTLLLCSEAPLGCEHQGLTITNKDFLQQIFSQEYVVKKGRLGGLYPEARFVVSTAVRSAAGDPVAIVLVSSPTTESLSVLTKLSQSYLLASLLVILAAVIAMTVYARKNANPLRQMAKTAIAFGHGDLQARAAVPKDSPEEIQELALAFNNMAASLEKSEYQRKEFVANVSHELKTPMTTIGGYLDGMLDGTIPKEKHRYYMQIVSDETRRLSRLVRSMLDISRLQEQGGIPEEQKSQFDLVECAGQVLITFEQKITEKQADVQIFLPEHPVYTLANQDYITQVIYNLLDNAVKFCPQGGQLGVRLRDGDRKVYFSVFNDGETIPAQELSLIFDRFYKLDKSRSQHREGWGLGLYIVNTIICSHGENISVSSAEGKTEFTFTLPLIH